MAKAHSTVGWFMGSLGARMLLRWVTEVIPGT